MIIREQIAYEMILSIYSGHTTERSTMRETMMPKNDSSLTMEDNLATIISAQTKMSSFGSFLEWVVV